MTDWSDLRLFLAMVEHGSLSAASRAVAVSQPTLSRRLTALEENLGSDLFVRSVEGLLLTPTGEQLIIHAKRMQEEAIAIERIASGEDQRLSGIVTISAIESVGVEWLTEQLLPLHKQYPDITLNLNISSESSDLLRREADIALRMYRPTEPDLIAKKLAVMSYGFYAVQSYLDRAKPIEGIESLKNHRMVLPNNAILQYLKTNEQKMADTFGPAAFVTSSMIGMTTATLAGYGVGIHSNLSAARHPELIKVCDEDIMQSDVWLVTHKDINRNARIRVVFDYINTLFEKNRALFKKC